MRRWLLPRLLLTVAALSAPGAVAAADDGFNGAPLGDDGRFTNLSGELGHGTLAVKIPFILRRLGTSFRSGEGAPVEVGNDGAFLRENASHSVPTATWIGHSTLLVQMDHVSFLTDPIWSDRPSPVAFLGPRRYVKPGLEIDELPAIDFVIVSHNHYDHLDVPTLQALAERDPATVFYVPLGNGKLLRKKGIGNVQELDWGQTAAYGGVTVHCLPSQHWSKRSLTDDHKALWSSWAVTGSTKRFYFAGDSGYFPGFEVIGSKLGPFDLVALPIGAYAPRAMMRESHLDPEEALQAAIDLRASRAVAMHFGTFDVSDEPLAEPPLRFKAAAKQSRMDEEDAWVLNIGETRTF